MKQIFFSILLALTVNILTAQIVANAAENSHGVTTKALPKSQFLQPTPDDALIFSGHVDGNTEYPNHVEIINKGISTNGLNFIKRHLFGFVIDHPKKKISIYWLNGRTIRTDAKILKIKSWGIKDGATRFKETYTTNAEELTVYYNLVGEVTGYVFEHREYPDPQGQFTTAEGVITEFE